MHNNLFLIFYYYYSITSTYFIVIFIFSKKARAKISITKRIKLRKLCVIEENHRFHHNAIIIY